VAVFTPISHVEVEALLTSYEVGGLHQCQGIAEGVENTNYLLETTQANYILTLFEGRVAANDLPFFVEVMQGLHAQGIPCPLPIEDRNGQVIQQIKGKSAMLVSFLQGQAARSITPTHLEALGRQVGQMHLAGEQVAATRPNSMGFKHWPELAQAIGQDAEAVQPGLTAILAEEITFLQAHWPKGLTQGLIHADLFPDNVFFDETGQLSGVIDWYFACHELRLYELAIIINAWCFEKDALHQARVTALCRAYQEVAPLPEDEWRALTLLCRAAALRFLLTRTQDWVKDTGKALITPKDPLEYFVKLEYFRQHKVQPW